MTYNPYTRAVKESINVDFENRYSNQKVILCNRENKFYGTFIGLIKDSQFELSGGTLTDVRLSNVVILDSEGKEINLSRINERLEDIYYNLDVISSSLKTTISDTIPAISIELNSAISANSVDISSLFSKLVTLSANSSSGLSILESYISSNLYNLSSELSTTKQNIKTNSDEIDYISGYIKNLDYEREIPHAHMISSINQVDGKITSFGYRPMETDDISNVALIPDDFSKRFDDRRIRFEYNKEGKMILLGVKTDELHKDNMLSIDCADFLRDGFLDTIRTGVDAGDPLGQYIELVWNTDVGKESTKIYVRNILSGIYTGIGGVIQVNDYLQISADISALREQIGYNELYNYYEYLAGLSSPADIGEIGRINDKISDLYQIETKNLKYIGHIISPAALSSTTFKNYLENQALCKDFVYNGSFLPVKFLDNTLSISTTDGLTVGNGDIVIIHDHADKLKINLDNISIGDNVYVVKAGVSRYEYEKTVSKKLKISSDVNEISNWMDDNFVGFLNFESGQITPKKDVILTSNLSVIGTSNVGGNISIYGNMSSYADTYLTHLGSPSVDINNLSVENSIIDHLSVGNLSANVLKAEFSKATNLIATNSKLTNLTSVNSILSNSNISNLNVIDSKISVINSNVISVKTIYPENLSANSGLLKDGEVAKIITNIIETNGIIGVSSEILEQYMINGLSADLDNISAYLNKTSGDISVISNWIDENFDYFPNEKYSIIKPKQNIFISTNISSTGEISSTDITAVNATIGVLSAKDISVDNIVPKNLSTDICVLVNSQLKETYIITSLYQTNGIINISSELLNEGHIDGLVSDLENINSEISTLSTDFTTNSNILCGAINTINSTISNFLSNEITSINSEIDYLSGLISTKIFVGNYISNDIKGDYSDLSVLKTTMDEYQQLLVDGRLSTDLSNTIFITTDKNINAFGEKIINLADATELSDAVNLGQVEHIINSVSSNLNSNITEKIWIGNDLSSGEYTNLSVVKVSSDKYQQLLVDGVISSSLSNTLFIVNDDSQINAMGQKITNLKDGTDLSDAVNLGQLKSAQSTTLSGYPDLSSVQWDSLSLGEIGEMLKFIFKKMGGLNS